MKLFPESEMVFAVLKYSDTKFHAHPYFFFNTSLTKYVNFNINWYGGTLIRIDH